MLRRFAWALLAATVFSGFGATAALSADTDEFADFPDVPETNRFDATFRDAGFYLGARGGGVWANDTDFTIAGPQRVENAYDVGYVGSAFIGFDLPDLYYGLGLRVEGEVGTSRLDVDNHTVGGTAVTSAVSFGATNATFGMANLYVDYGIGALRPFIAGGVGVARVEFDNHGVTAAPGVMDDTSNGFAWQAMAGVGVDVTSALTLEAMVRYQGVEDVGLTSSTGPKTQVDLGSTQVMLGARFNF
ncbi:MAG: outer membrane protein [Devosiaceae bacterium]